MCRYSSRAALASTEIPHTSPPPAWVTRRTSSMPSGGTSKVWLMPCRPSTSASSTRFPWRDRASARAEATVVLPTPPLPVTTCRRTPSMAREREGVATASTLDGVATRPGCRPPPPPGGRHSVRGEGELLDLGQDEQVGVGRGVDEVEVVGAKGHRGSQRLVGGAGRDVGVDDGGRHDVVELAGDDDRRAGQALAGGVGVGPRVGGLLGGGAEQLAGGVVAQAEAVYLAEVGGRGECDDPGEPGGVVVGSEPERQVTAGGVPDD